jgi:hypothetical protein
MKIRVNTKIIQELNPCKDRLDNWLKHYPKFNQDITKFLHLKNITHTDKLWVALRLISLEMRVIFALDCSFSAYAADADAYAYAADAYDYAFAAASYADVYAAYADVYAADAEQARQIEALIYLIEGDK